jgi:hypothetical protein
MADIKDANKEERVYSGFQIPPFASERRISKHIVLCSVSLASAHL